MNETNENPVVQEETQTQDNYKEYIDQINKLKSNTVSKDEYEALKSERNELINNLVNGQTVSTEANEPKPELSELRKQLFQPNHELNDVEYVTKTLELRKRVLEETGKDCFVSGSHAYSPTNDDYDKAQRVAEVLQDCVDSCNGSNAQFIALLQSRMNDTIIPGRRK